MAHTIALINLIRLSLNDREDTEAGSIVYTLRGRDPLNRPVTYSASGDLLSVNPVTGEVVLVKPVDREIIDTIETIITVSGENEPFFRFIDRKYTILITQTVIFPEISFKLLYLH